MKNNNGNKKAGIITTKKLAASAMLIAMTIVLENMLGFKIAQYQVTLNFIPIVIGAMLFGPVYSLIIYGLADFIGALIFSGYGAWIPLLTLTSAAIGAVYGLAFYRAKIPATWTRAALRALLCSVVIALCFTLTINAYILVVFYESAFVVFMPGRFLQVCVMLPLQVVLIPLIWRKLIPLLSSWSQKKPTLTALPDAGECFAKSPVNGIAGLLLLLPAIILSIFPITSYVSIVFSFFSVLLCDRNIYYTHKREKLSSVGLIVGWISLIVSVLSSFLYSLLFFASENFLTNEKLEALRPLFELFNLWLDKVLSIF